MSLLVSDLKTNVVNKIGLSSSEGSLVLTWLTEGYRDIKQKIPLAALAAEPTSDFAGTENLSSGLGFSPLGPFALALEYYALWQAAEYDDKGVSQRATDYRAQYEQYMRELMPVVVTLTGYGTTAALQKDIQNFFGLQFTESAIVLRWLTYGYRDLAQKVPFSAATLTADFTGAETLISTLTMNPVGPLSKALLYYGMWQASQYIELTDPNAPKVAASFLEDYNKFVEEARAAVVALTGYGTIGGIQNNVQNTLGLSTTETGLILRWATQGYRDLASKVPFSAVTLTADVAAGDTLIATLAMNPVGPLGKALEAYVLWKAAEYKDKNQSERVREYAKLYDKFVLEAYSAVAASATGGTVNALKINIRNKLGMSVSESALILTYLTNGYRDLLDKTHFYTSKTTISITSGTSEYQLAVGVGEIDDLTVTGSLVKPERVTREEILDLQRYANSGTAQGDIYCYSVYGNLLNIYPTPTASYTITVYYSAETAVTDLAGTEALVADLKMVPLGPLQDALEAYGMWRATEYIDKGVSKRTQQARAEYDALVITARKHVRKRAGRGLVRARVGYPVRRAYPGDNSAYPGWPGRGGY